MHACKQSVSYCNFIKVQINLRVLLMSLPRMSCLIAVNCNDSILCTNCTISNEWPVLNAILFKINALFIMHACKQGVSYCNFIKV